MNAAQIDPHSSNGAPAPLAAGETLETRLLRRILQGVGNPRIELVLWNGAVVRPDAAQGAPLNRVLIKDRATLYGLMRDTQVHFGDAFSAGRIEIEGDLVQLLESVYRAATPQLRRGVLARLVGRLHAGARRPRQNTLAGSRENIHHHYDIGNEFYSLWLGSTMAYTCAYYPTSQTTLDQAQVAKFDHVCRKLRLRAGESVVEAGCGWGGLALHMAQHYGVKVRAFNISKEQIRYARERARALGLEGRAEFVEDDYRAISGQYDAFMSVGMLEHVGVENYPALGRLIRRVLPAHGRGLIHSIGRNTPGELQAWIEKRIFPGACPPSIGQFMQIFECANLSVLDVENLRLHYAQTLRHWLERYEANVARVRELYDEKFVRMWRLYLAGSIAGFTTGTLQLFQVVFAPSGNNDVPMTRAHLYP
ncbi:MAG: class I SAM-dependent methyltransferase [Gammaproteobacteria bacterium]|nr:class I SAM-dependent methyltransferase [Gammaproteobacteria bacterium]